MQFKFPFIDVLVIPTGAGPGDARIEIDGILGEIRVYDSNGDLVGHWDSNEFEVNHPTNGSYVLINPSGTIAAAIFLHTDDLAGYSAGSIQAQSDANGTPLLSLVSPIITGQPHSILNLFGDNSGTGRRAHITMDVDIGEFVVIQAGDTGVIAGGYRKDAFSTSFSAAIGAETVALTITNFNFRDNRAYRISYGQMAQSSAAANQEIIYRFRKTNAAGTLYGDVKRHLIPLTGIAYATEGNWIVRRNDGAGDLTTTVVLTIEGIGGNVQQAATATSPRYLLIEDIGSASAYQFAFSVT